MKLKRILKWTAIIVPLVLILWGFTAYWSSTNDCDQRTGAPIHPMKAIRYCEYGSPDVVKFEDVEKPMPSDDHDRRYTLGETPEALRYLNEGHARGKIIITAN